MTRWLGVLIALTVAPLAACGGPSTPDDATPSDTSRDDANAPDDAGADAPRSDAVDAVDAVDALTPADVRGPDAPSIVFQCAGLAGGICVMNADGSARRTLAVTGRSPDRNAAGDVLFHDDSYQVHRLAAAGGDFTLGPGAFARWASDGTIVFQCAGLAGGICVMNADGSARRTLVATGRVPDRNAAGDIVFHDDGYSVQLRRASGVSATLGAGANAEWTADGTLVFQCAGLAGGLCAMHADGSARATLRARGRSPDRNPSGGMLFHDDSYVLHYVAPDGSERPLGDGAFGRWIR